MHTLSQSGNPSRTLRRRGLFGGLFALWEEWDSRLRPMLIQSQVKSGDMAGSWHPYNPIPDRWGAFGGRLYVTTMNLLSLEVRHRMLPLYKKTNQADEK